MLSSERGRPDLAGPNTVAAFWGLCAERIQTRKRAIQVFRSRADLEQIVANSRVDAIVLPAGTDAADAFDAVRSLGVTAGGVVVPILAPHEVAFRQVKALATAGFAVNPAASHPIDLDPLLENDRGLRPTLLRAVAVSLPDPLVDVLIPALVIGTHHVSMGDWEALCTLKARSIRRRLFTNGMASPRRILGAVAGFAVAYRSDVLGMRLSECSSAAGFVSEKQLRDYLKTTTGLTPSVWRTLGPDGALARLTGLLSDGRTGFR